MDADLLDPMFAYPFATGLVFAVLLPLLGMYLRLREEWLAALAYSHLAAAGSLLAAVLGVPVMAGALLAAAGAAAAKGWLARTGNNGYAVLMILGWSLGVLVLANVPIAEHLAHALFDGQLYFTSAGHLAAAAVFLAACGALLPRLSRPLLLERMLPDFFTASGHSPLRYHLAFDLLTAAGLAFATSCMGVMAAFGLVFVPSMIAYRAGPSWKAALLLAAAIGTGCYLAAFLAALSLDQPFGPVLVLVLIATTLAGLVGRIAWNRARPV
jgi:zinc transport system permease protein